MESSHIDKLKEFLSLPEYLTTEIQKKEFYKRIFREKDLYETLNPELKEKIYNFCTQIKSVHHGTSFFVALREDGKVITWGSNQYNQLQDSSNDYFKSVVCGQYHTVGIRDHNNPNTDGTLVIWGDKSQNQRSNFPRGKFKMISCGSRHSVGIRDHPDPNVDDTVVVWGNSSHNQYLNTPSGKFKYICCGGNHSVGIRKHQNPKIDGTIVTWGSNSYGQCRNTPPGRFVTVSCGMTHSAAIREDGALFIWGDDSFNQLGDTFGRYKSVYCGPYNTIALFMDGYRRYNQGCVYIGNHVVEYQNLNLNNEFKSGHCSSLSFILLTKDGYAITQKNLNYINESTYDVTEYRFKSVICNDGIFVGITEDENPKYDSRIVVWGTCLSNYIFPEFQS